MTGFLRSLRAAADLLGPGVYVAQPYLCKRAHVTRRLSRRQYRRWQEDRDRQVHCRCGRPAHPIGVGRYTVTVQPQPGDTWTTPDGRPWFVIDYGHDLTVIDDDLTRPAVAGPTVIDDEGTAHRFHSVAEDCGGLTLAYRPDPAEDAGKLTGGSS